MKGADDMTHEAVMLEGGTTEQWGPELEVALEDGQDKS